MGIFIDWQTSDLPVETKHATLSSATSQIRSLPTSTSVSNSTSSSLTSTGSSRLATGAKAGIGIGVALALVLLIGLSLLVMRNRRLSREQATKAIHGNVAEGSLPPELPNKMDRPELEGERGVELGAEEMGHQLKNERIAELEAELSRLRDTNIAELP